MWLSLFVSKASFVKSYDHSPSSVSRIPSAPEALFSVINIFLSEIGALPCLICPALCQKRLISVSGGSACAAVAMRCTRDICIPCLVGALVAIKRHHSPSESFSFESKTKFFYVWGVQRFVKGAHWLCGISSHLHVRGNLPDATFFEPEQASARVDHSLLEPASTLRRLLRREWHSLQECHGSQLFDQDVASTRHYIQNWTDNTKVKVLFCYVIYFGICTCNLIVCFETGPNTDLEIKTYHQSEGLVKNNPLLFPARLYDA